MEGGGACRVWSGRELGARVQGRAEGWGCVRISVCEERAAVPVQSRLLGAGSGEGARCEQTGRWMVTDWDTGISRAA